MPFGNQSAGIFFMLLFLLDELNAFLHRHAPRSKKTAAPESEDPTASGMNMLRSPAPLT
jgi:hypothetical protein